MLCLSSGFLSQIKVILGIDKKNRLLHSVIRRQRLSGNLPFAHIFLIRFLQHL